jgi:flagellar M-ring protein FliF
MTEERVDPNMVAARSFQITEERDSTSASTAGGVPGAVGTLEGADTNLSGNTATGVTRRSETRNFEISKTVRRNVEPVGRVMRLSVAVVVDGTWKGKGDKRTFVTRPAAELATIKTVVATAAGTKEERGDKITVECVPFAEQPIEVAELPTGFDAVVKKNLPAVAGGTGALLLLAVGGTIFVMTRKKKKQERLIDLKLSPESPPQLRVETAQAISPKSIPPSVAEDPALTADAQAEAERIRAVTAEIASGDPYLAARVVRGWLSENSSEEAA